MQIRTEHELKGIHHVTNVLRKEYRSLRTLFGFMTLIHSLYTAEKMVVRPNAVTSPCDLVNLNKFRRSYGGL